MREIDEMNAQIDQTSAARFRGVVEPWLVGTVGVVKHEIGGVDATDAAGGDLASHRVDCIREAIRQIDAEETICPARRIDHAARLELRAAERLLAEDGHTAIERSDRLLGMQRARRGDHDTVEIAVEQLIE